MHVRCQLVAELTDAHWASWSRVRHDNPALASPLFSPTLVRLVAEVRPGLEVGVLGEEPRAFLPFHREDQTGLPWAGCLQDVGGAVAEREADWDAERFITECGLTALQLKYVLAGQSPFVAHHAVRTEAPYFDLSHGFDDFRARSEQQSGRFAEAVRKSAKLARTHGPLRFEPLANDDTLFARLMEWKHAQLAARHEPNALRTDWVEPLLRRVLHTGTDDLAGMLSATFVGEQPVAMTFCVRSGGVLHGWVMAYDREWSRFSPGLIHLVELARAAERLGIHRLDLGPGDEPFKQCFSLHSVPVANGWVDTQPLRRLLRSQWQKTRERIRVTPLGPPAKKVLQYGRHLLRND